MTVKESYSVHCNGLKRYRFTLIELLIVIAIIAILAAILLPALQTARARGVASNCISMRKQVSFWIFQYTEVYDGMMMPYEWGDQSDNTNKAYMRWYSALAGYQNKRTRKALQITKWNRLDQNFGCPATASLPDVTTPTKGSSINYNMNFHYVKVSKIRNPSVKFVITDAASGYKFSHNYHVSDLANFPGNPNTNGQGFYPQHKSLNAGTMLHADGSISLIKLTEMIYISQNNSLKKRHFYPEEK